MEKYLFKSKNKLMLKNKTIGINLKKIYPDCKKNDYLPTLST